MKLSSCVHFLLWKDRRQYQRKPVVKYCVLKLKLNSIQIGSSHFFVWPEVTSHCLLTHQNTRGSLFHNVCSVYIPHFVGLMTHVREGTKINRGHGGQKGKSKSCERENWCCLGSRSKGVGWPKGKKTKHCINRLIKSKSISLFRLKFLNWKKKKAVTGSSDCWKSFHNLPRVLS